jgi:hypothetical protein
MRRYPYLILPNPLIARNASVLQSILEHGYFRDCDKVVGAASAIELRIKNKMIEDLEVELEHQINMNRPSTKVYARKIKELEKHVAQLEEFAKGNEEFRVFYAARPNFRNVSGETDTLLTQIELNNAMEQLDKAREAKKQQELKAEERDRNPAWMEAVLERARTRITKRRRITAALDSAAVVDGSDDE